MKEKITKKQKADKAVKIRWDTSIPKATHGHNSKPLMIGDIILSCFVLSDGRRVLLQKNIASSLGINDNGGDRITSTLSSKAFYKYVNENIILALNNPIKFKTCKGRTALGYDATLLVDICETTLKARDAGEYLTEKQFKLTKACEILLRSFAKVGLIALIDETTGYQEDRTRNALSEILNKFINNELTPWIKMFPLDYYKNLFRLRNLPEESTNIPSYFGHLTNDIVYKRLAPEILKELKRKTPKSDKGHTTARFHQSLTDNYGKIKLTSHISSVITLMKLSNDYDSFEEKLNMIHPLY